MLRSGGPASSSRTLFSGCSVRRLASTHPAEPGADDDVVEFAGGGHRGVCRRSRRGSGLVYVVSWPILALSAVVAIATTAAGNAWRPDRTRRRPGDERAIPRWNCQADPAAPVRLPHVAELLDDRAGQRGRAAAHGRTASCERDAYAWSIASLDGKAGRRQQRPRALAHRRARRHRAGRRRLRLRRHRRPAGGRRRELLCALRRLAQRRVALGVAVHRRLRAGQGRPARRAPRSDPLGEHVGAARGVSADRLRPTSSSRSTAIATPARAASRRSI